MTPAEFESAVAALLRLAGYDVQGETLLGHKKIDLYAEEVRLGRRRRVAVECKLYTRSVTQEELNRIYANYRPLYDTNLVDEILVVTTRGLSPSARTFASTARGLSHLTFVELQNCVIDFTAHISATIAQVSEDGLDSYYVPPKIRGDEDLEQLLTTWILSGERPLAILGGYGMGKTSFARHMAAALARKASSDPSARIPIIIKLADISAEQSLEGLLGRVLATTGSVRNYTFEAFMELNRRGRFVTFLDGFDEMKHTLVWDQFRFNFRQLNRLVEGSARVVVLGRPTAFLSDNEHQFILHGIRRSGTTDIRDPEWPDYEEVELRPFSPAQVTSFLRRYAEHLRRSRRALDFRAEVVAEKLNDLPPERLADLATRPVQLKILSEVLPQWRGDASDLTPAKLYSAFINIVIEREQDKITRRRFDVQERRAFARELAYWLWLNRTVMSIDAAHIPAEVFPIPKGDDALEGVKRDLVSACFLERKIGGALYFPHRSFQEFLVAEKIVLDMRLGNCDIRRMCDAVTGEVAEFLTSLVEPDDFERFSGFLARSTGGVTKVLIDSFVRNEDCARKLASDLSRGPISRWVPVQAACAILAGSKVMTQVIFFRNLTKAASDMSASARVVAMFAALAVARYSPRAPTLAQLSDLFAALFEAAYDDFTKTREGRAQYAQPLPMVFLHTDIPEVGVGKRVPRLDKKRHGASIAFDFRKAFLALANELRSSVMLRDWADDAQTPDHAARMVVSGKPSKDTFVSKDYQAGDTLSDMLLRRLIRLETTKKRTAKSIRS